VFHLRRSADGQFERTLAEIVAPEPTTIVTDLPLDTRGVISSRPLLIRAGNIETGFPDDPITIAYQRTAHRDRDVGRRQPDVARDRRRLASRLDRHDRRRAGHFLRNTINLTWRWRSTAALDAGPRRRDREFTIGWCAAQRRESPRGDVRR
jgi:hypothetical protein